jgi:hypothetical protein
MPSFSSHFHLSCPRGAERAAQEKVATDKWKCLRQEKARKQMERQKREASSSDGDEDDDDDDDDSKEDDKDLAALQSVPNALLGSCSGAESSGADGTAGAEAKESSAQKRAASSPLRGPSLK